jgi:hypothetical protein
VVWRRGEEDFRGGAVRGVVQRSTLGECPEEKKYDWHGRRTWLRKSPFLQGFGQRHKEKNVDVACRGTIKACYDLLRWRLLVNDLQAVDRKIEGGRLL